MSVKYMVSGLGRYLLFLMILSFTAKTVQGQDIQKLPADPDVNTGVLPNGMSWYVAVNKSVKGVADFALVQLTGTSTASGVTPEKVVSLSREALAGQPRLLSESVQDFFINHGVLPGAGGFVSVSEHATTFRFSDVDLLQSSSMLDSTLLVLMGIAERSFVSDDPLLKKWYVPSDQALIVAGDVDPTTVSEKLLMLSYMLPPSQPAQRKGYAWEDRDGMIVEVSSETSSSLATVCGRWRLQRTPEEYMNTIQPLIMERFMTELGLVAEDRILKGMQKEGVPLASVSSRYEGSADTIGDEVLEIAMSVKPEYALKAVSLLAEVLSSLKAGDADITEIKKAGFGYLDNLSAYRTSNAGNVDRCVSSFIYKSPIVPVSQKSLLHSSKELTDSVVLSLFNSIASATLSEDRNFTLSVTTPDCRMTADSVRTVFGTSWKHSHEALPVKGTVLNEVPHLQGESEKMTVRSIKKEPVSGGSVWRLANGMRIIVKNIPSGGKVYYSLSLNGGFGNIEDLNAGEGAYISDFPKLCRFGGVSAERFIHVLRQNGMTMDFDVDFSTTSVKGTVPKNSLDYMMRALLTVMNDMSADEEAFDRYIKSEQLRLNADAGGLKGRICVIDSLMCPGYRYISSKVRTLPAKGLAAKAEKFFRSRAEKVNDGYLILVGEVDEKLLRQAVQSYAGGFKTSEMAFSRPVVGYQPTSGTVTYESAGGENCMDMVISAPIPITADNVFAAEIAVMALRKSLIRQVADKGMYVRLSHQFRRHPHERLGLMVSLYEASVEGFAPGTSHEDPQLALSVVREELENMGRLTITDAELASYKNRIKHRIALEKDTPEYWRRAIERRYLDGKDFTTGCDVRIDAVTAEDVRSLLGKLSEGSKAEYVIKKR